MGNHGLFRHLELSALVSVLMSSTASVALAQPGGIATDGTVGSALTLSSPGSTAPVIIDSAVGTTKGGNLFHSFQRFGINSGQVVTFTDSANGSLSNVLSRVTGGTATEIQGTLKSTIPGANVWLINPAGVVFGAGAKVDVPAAFHVSTANEVRFADGNTFSATAPGGSTLTTAAPQAFGFLGGANAGAIRIEGAKLTLADQATATIAAGDLSISGGELVARRGVVNMTAVGNAATAVSAADGSSSATPQGSATLSNKSWVSVSGGDAGWIRLRAGTVAMSGASYLDATNNGTRNSDFFRVDSKGGIRLEGGDIRMESNSSISTRSTLEAGNAGSMTVVASGTLELYSGSQITSSTSSPYGNAGKLNITAKTLTIDRKGGLPTFISSDTSSGGNAGTIDITIGDRLWITGGGQITSQGFFGSWGKAGTITVSAGSVAIDRGGSAYDTGISTDAKYLGDAGAVVVRAREAIAVTEGGAISSSTGGFGNAGSISVSGGSVTLDSKGSLYTTGIVSETTAYSFGRAGSVSITTPGELRVLGGSVISTSAYGRGDAGSISVQVGSLVVDSTGSQNTSTISSNAWPGSTGSAGNISIQADGDIRLRDNAFINTGTWSPTGNAGTIQVTSSHGSIGLDQGFITSIATGPIDRFYVSNGTGTGRAGDITVAAPEGALTMQGGSLISSAAQAKGNAGTVSVSADTVALRQASFIDSSTLASGRGGDVRVSGRTIGLESASALSAVASTTGTAGYIYVTGGALNLAGRSAIITRSQSGGGGGIDVRLSDRLYLFGGGITTEVAGGMGSAGGIFIDPEFVVLNHGLIRANAIGGNGGNIAIRANTFLSSQDSVVEASSQRAVSGTIAISAPKIETGAATAVQTDRYREISSQLGFSCAGRNGAGGSALTSSGRGGLSLSADMPVPAFYVGELPASAEAMPATVLPAVAQGRPDGVFTIACNH